MSETDANLKHLGLALQTGGRGIGVGYVPPELGKKDTAIEIEIRGKRAPAVIVAKPIYRKDPVA